MKIFGPGKCRACERILGDILSVVNRIERRFSDFATPFLRGEEAARHLEDRFL